MYRSVLRVMKCERNANTKDLKRKEEKLNDFRISVVCLIHDTQQNKVYRNTKCKIRIWDLSIYCCVKFWQFVHLIPPLQFFLSLMFWTRKSWLRIYAQTKCHTARTHPNQGSTPKYSYIYPLHISVAQMVKKVILIF